MSAAESTSVPSRSKSTVRTVDTLR
jgi:hypothetical protein